MQTGIEALKAAVRDVPDFPKKGILFKDITPLLSSPTLFRAVIDRLVERYRTQGIDIVASVESRGFILGGPLAYLLGAGFVPLRKKGKLPWQTIGATYTLEYGTGELEMHRDAIQPGQRVLLLDDLLATGGTVEAAVQMIRTLKGEIIEIAFLIELTFLHGRARLNGQQVFSLIQF